MKQLIGLFIALMSFAAFAGVPLPIESGSYKFQHRFAEQPWQGSITVDVQIDGHHILIFNNDSPVVFPLGLIYEGTLMWHARSSQWIIGETAADAELEDVGGCSDGPEVVDLDAYIFWTC